MGLLLLLEDTSCLRFICTNVREHTSPVQTAARGSHRPPALTLAAGGLHSAACVGAGHLGEGRAVAVVPGPWFEPWPGTSGPLVMWAPARCWASGERGR